MLEQSSFGEWLRLKRKGLDLTHEGLAAQVRCSAATIRKLESEERRPSTQMVERMADIFQIPQGERSQFRRFARGDWQSAPGQTMPAEPWQRTVRISQAKLPATSTSLIGRERNIHEMGEYLRNPDIRLVTLFGPPGIGKTRLSIAAARAVLPDFPGGVFFASLAPIDDPTLLTHTIAQALGFVSVKNFSTKEQLIDGIGEKQILLVLDNCEHLINDVASLAADLLNDCPQMKILATSRESLRIPGEWLYLVPTLDIPKESALIHLASAASYPALILFAERARAVRADFVLDQQNIAAASSICSHLEGLPLAIELIAARTRLMSLNDLLEHLDHQFLLSAEGMRYAAMPRGVPERQKTLYNAIEWSYNLLSEDEKKAFACLGVFSGIFTYDAAEAIISRTAAGKSASDLIALLLDKSLLQRTTDAYHQTRLTMLVTIRQFALDRLRGSGKETETRKCHLEYFLDLAEKGDQAKNGPDQVAWLGRIAADYDNLRAALEWTAATGQTEAALRMACNLYWYWFKRSDFTDSWHWLGTVVAQPDAASYPEWYAAALCCLANHTIYAGKEKEARFFTERSLKIASEQENRRNMAEGKLSLGMILLVEGNFEAARTMAEESRALFEELGDEWNAEAHIVQHLALIAHAQQDWDGSINLHQRALASFRKFGDIFYQGAALSYIGQAYLMQGKVMQGLAALREALLLDQQLGSKNEISNILPFIGEAYYQAGDSFRAVCLAWATNNIKDSLGVWWEEDKAKLEQDLAVWRASMPQAEYVKAVEQGRAMTIEQTVAYALEPAES